MTADDLNRWSADEIGVDGTVAWNPAEDLSQAWRELVPRMMLPGFLFSIDPPGDVSWCRRRAGPIELAEAISIKWTKCTGQGSTPDQRAAWALTCAFLESISCMPYLEAKRLEPENV